MNFALFDKNKQMSLRFRIISLSLGMVGFLGLISFFILQGILSFSKEEKSRALQGYAVGFANQIAAQFYERYGDVQAFAANPVFRSGSRSEMQDSLNTLVKLYGIYDLVLVVDKDGRYISSNNVKPDGSELNVSALEKLNYGNETWFKSVLNNNFTSQKSKAFDGTFVEQPMWDHLVSEVYKTDGLGNSFSAPIKNSRGETIAVITNRANWKWVENELLLLSKKMVESGFKHAELMVMDGSFNVVTQVNNHNLDSNKELRDPTVVLKMNELKEGSDVAKELSSKSEGYISEVPPGDDELHVTGFKRLDTDKIVDSLGWSVVIREAESSLLSRLNTEQMKFLIIFSLSLICFGFIGYYYSSKLSAQFTRVAEELKTTSEKTLRTSLELNDASHELAVSSNEQAAAVQETVASMAEMRSMINQTSQNADDSMLKTKQVKEKTDEGLRIMQRMVSAMESIQQANVQLHDMANIINEISNKTAVINDIVFKTQLLSFNASIEAARAGIHGKGFAVVAEEVGNLAQLSGNAAKDIQALLQDSQKQTNSIIELTQERVHEAQVVSSEALTTFNVIAKEVDSISSAVQSITEATKEQESGVQQTSSAMTQLDETTQRNNQAANLTSDLSTILKDQADNLQRVLEATKVLVLGSDNDDFYESDKLDVVDKILKAKVANISAKKKPQHKKKAGKSLSDLSAELVNSKENAEHTAQNANPDDSDFKKPA